MLDKPTNELDEILLNTPSSQLKDYFEENADYLSNPDRSFYNYYKDILKTKGIRLKDVYLCADVSESYGQQVISMQKHTSNRDLIIVFCMAGHFNNQETNRALKLYGFSELYSKNRRDACIMLEIKNRHFEPYLVDEALERNGFDKLKRNTDEE